MYLRSTVFEFDRVFSETEDNDCVYASTAAPLVRKAAEGGVDDNWKDPVTDANEVSRDGTEEIASLVRCDLVAGLDDGNEGAGTQDETNRGLKELATGVM